ncbi:MAG: carbon storage regulator [Candidatus Andersenbacteria bacterium]
MSAERITGMGSLVLRRKLGTSFKVGPNITIDILDAYGATVKVRIRAPLDTNVVRCELHDRILD